MEQAMSVRKRVFELTHPNAAGIDVGAARHFVAVPPDRDAQAVREYPSFTEDLNRLAEWLRACEVDTVAMESTGVYWIPLFELLESRGFTVYLVNARHVKNVSGRKSDVLDCQWLQQLMSFGLLSGAFRPTGEICALRSVARQRAMLLSYQSRHVQHMQKALTQMNIQLAQVISDVVGETGQRIIRACLAGERNGHVLAKLKHFRIRATEEEITKALQVSIRNPSRLPMSPMRKTPRCCTSVPSGPASATLISSSAGSTPKALSWSLCTRPAPAAIGSIATSPRSASSAGWWPPL